MVIFSLSLHCFCKVLKMPFVSVCNVAAPLPPPLCEVWAVSGESCIFCFKKNPQKTLLSQKETFYLTWQMAKHWDFPIANSKHMRLSCLLTHNCIKQKFFTFLITFKNKIPWIFFQSSDWILLQKVQHVPVSKGLSSSWKPAEGHACKWECRETNWFQPSRFWIL